MNAIPSNPPAKIAGSRSCTVPRNARTDARGVSDNGEQELVEVPAALDGAVRSGEEHRNELREGDARAEGSTRSDVAESAPALIVVREADGRREREHDRLVHELRVAGQQDRSGRRGERRPTARHGREECMTACSATSSIGIQAITRICSNWIDFDSVDPAAMAMSAAAVAPIRVMPSRRPSRTTPMPNSTTWPATRTPIARFVPNVSVSSCGGYRASAEGLPRWGTPREDLLVQDRQSPVAQRPFGDLQVRARVGVGVEADDVAARNPARSRQPQADEGDERGTA